MNIFSMLVLALLNLFRRQPFDNSTAHNLPIRGRWTNCDTYLFVGLYSYRGHRKLHMWGILGIL